MEGIAIMSTWLSNLREFVKHWKPSDGIYTLGHIEAKQLLHEVELREQAAFEKGRCVAAYTLGIRVQWTCTETSVSIHYPFNAYDCSGHYLGKFFARNEEHVREMVTAAARVIGVVKYVSTNKGGASWVK